MVSIFSRMKTFIAKTYETYITIPKVDKALQDLRDVIEGPDNDRFNKSNKPKISAASKTLSRYPDILESKGLGYLTNFVSKGLDEGMKLGDDKSATNLSQAIAMAIPEKKRNEIIATGGGFKPLANSRNMTTSSLALNINIMEKYDKGDERSASGAKRAKLAVLANLKKQGMDENAAAAFEIKLLEVSPLAYGSYASDPSIIKCNDAPYVIVAPKDGLDSKRYRDGIQAAENIHKEINSMAKNGIDEGQLKLLNERAKEIRNIDKFAVKAIEMFLDQPSKQASKQASQFQSALTDQGVGVTNAGLPNKGTALNTERSR